MNLPVLKIDEDGEWRINPGGEKNTLYWDGMTQEGGTYALVRVADGETATAERLWRCAWRVHPIVVPEPPKTCSASSHRAAGCGWVLVVRGAADE